MTGAGIPRNWLERRLAEPKGEVRVVLDTGAADEVDDQFALAWALLSPEVLQVQALYAAPFSFAHRRGQLPHAAPDARPFNPPDQAGVRTPIRCTYWFPAVPPTTCPASTSAPSCGIPSPGWSRWPTAG